MNYWLTVQLTGWFTALKLVPGVYTVMIFVTEPGKTDLIYTKCACLYYGMYLLFCMCYPKSVNFNTFLMDFYIYDDVVDTIHGTDKKLLHFKLSKSGQILHVDKTCFPRPSHILLLLCSYIIMCIHMCINEKVSKLQNKIH